MIATRSCEAVHGGAWLPHPATGKGGRQGGSPPPKQGLLATRGPGRGRAKGKHEGEVTILKYIRGFYA